MDLFENIILFAEPTLDETYSLRLSLIDPYDSNIELIYCRFDPKWLEIMKGEDFISTIRQQMIESYLMFRPN